MINVTWNGEAGAGMRSRAPGMFGELSEELRKLDSGEALDIEVVKIDGGMLGGGYLNGMVIVDLVVHNDIFKEGVSALVGALTKHFVDWAVKRRASEPNIMYDVNIFGPDGKVIKRVKVPSER
jgi:hypothetical protein